MMAQFCRELAAPFLGQVEVVAAPAVGAIVLAVLTARHRSMAYNPAGEYLHMSALVSQEKSHPGRRIVRESLRLVSKARAGGSLGPRVGGDGLARLAGLVDWAASVAHDGAPPQYRLPHPERWQDASEILA